MTATDGTSGQGPWLLVVDAQRIFADSASDWASPFWEGAWERIRELAAAVGPERTLLTRWLPTADRSTAWGDYFAAWPFADVPATDPLAGVVGHAPQLLVTGVSTDCCVITTVLAAADAGARVTVVADACAASAAENAAAALHTMSLFPPQVDLRSTAEVLAAP